MTAGNDPVGPRHRAHGGSRSHNADPSGPSAGSAEPAAERKVRPAQRIWLQEDGVRMFGPGAHELLRRVEQTGSLNQAAKDMAMSYSKAWRVMHQVERRLGVTLFEARAGGPDGGGSCLTDQGRLLIQRFEAFTREADDAVEALFERHFGDLPYAATGGAFAGDEPRDDRSERGDSRA
jgi:molybdate transport system regulatory protein